MQGYIEKMRVRLGQDKEKPVQYELPIGGQLVALNPLIGKHVKLAYTGKIFCIHCNRPIKKSFNQGYCYPCFTSLAQCDMCIMKPETCHYAVGTCREPAWGEEFCFQPHIVYLANSSGIKVGITRQTQVPTRWIDQGAVQALPIFRVQSRHISGLIEVALAKHVNDKTSWQRMLKGQPPAVDLAEKRDELIAVCAPELAGITQQCEGQAVELLVGQPNVDIHYPVDRYPISIQSFNLDKNPDVSGQLQGIKGQYLLLDTGVINIRKFSGYELAFTA
jgi:hypothetical protein